MEFLPFAEKTKDKLLISLFCCGDSKLNAMGFFTLYNAKNRRNFSSFMTRRKSGEFKTELCEHSPTARVPTAFLVLTKIRTLFHNTESVFYFLNMENSLIVHGLHITQVLVISPALLLSSATVERF